MTSKTAASKKTAGSTPAKKPAAKKQPANKARPVSKKSTDHECYFKAWLENGQNTVDQNFFNEYPLAFSVVILDVILGILQKRLDGIPPEHLNHNELSREIVFSFTPEVIDGELVIEGPEDFDKDVMSGVYTLHQCMFFAHVVLNVKQTLVEKMNEYVLF